MKLLPTTAAAALIATAGIADTSDRYKDLRLDTSIVTEIDFNDKTTATEKSRKPQSSTRDSRRTQQRTLRSVFAYSNLFGVGPNNDSR